MVVCLSFAFVYGLLVDAVVFACELCVLDLYVIGLLLRGLFSNLLFSLYVLEWLQCGVTCWEFDLSGFMLGNGLVVCLVCLLFALWVVV